MKTATCSPPVEAQTAHKFKGGPFCGFRVEFPRKCVLDSPHTAWIAFPRGMSVQTALTWSDFETGSTSEGAPGSTSAAAVYRPSDAVPGEWLFVPRSTRPN